MVDIHTASKADSTALPSGASIADTVAAHLEPVTRFDRDDISQDAPDHAIAVSVMLTQVQTASFDLAWHAGPRHLPKHIARLGNGTALKVELNTQLRLARDECDGVLRDWVAQAPRAYRRVLPPDAVFRKPPTGYGIEFTCQSCFGKCQVACSGCAGGGQVACGLCQGAGTTMCAKCSGTTRLKCASCNGNGHTTEQVSEQRWDPATNAYVSYRAPVNRPCLACSGAGELHCTSCVFGQAQCGLCHGKRSVNCPTCSGAGCFACADCEATGVQHEWACVCASVSVEEDLSFGKVTPTLEALIRERIAPHDLPTYGALLETHHLADQMALGSRYELRIDALHARLHAAAQHFSIYALGPKAQVLDFVNIAGHLLEDDLRTLEGAVAPVSIWAPQDATLLNALKLFVTSELNLLIAERLGGQQAGSQPAAAVETHFHSMVDAAYVQRATVALRQGFDGLYGGNLLRPAAWVVGAAAVLAALVYTFGPARYGTWACLGWAGAGGALGWVGVEMLTLLRIMRHFPERIGARLHSQIKASGSVKRWRVALAAAVVASAWLGATLAAKIPFLRHQHEGRPVLEAVDTLPPAAGSWSIENDRSTAEKEGLYEIQQEARQFLLVHNKKYKTSFRVLEPNLKAQFPRCKAALTVAWVPKSYGLSSPAVFVRCKKSVSKHERKWEAIVPVAKTGG